MTNKWKSKWKKKGEELSAKPHTLTHAHPHTLVGADNRNKDKNIYNVKMPKSTECWSTQSFHSWLRALRRCL